MFDGKEIASLTEKYQPLLRDLSFVEDVLRIRYGGADRAIRALILSVASGEPLLFVGPPGTGKSQLIRDFCALCGITAAKASDNGDSSDGEYFEYLLTPFTEPSELFGFYDIGSLQKGVPQRLDKGMMQNAKVIYLDEVFNGSSAILNSILTFMNERAFHERGKTKKVAMEYMFGASNRVPDSAVLRAIYDRFIIRCNVENVPHRIEPFKELIQKGWWGTFGQPVADGKQVRSKEKKGEYEIFLGLLPGLSEMRDGIMEHVIDKRRIKPENESGIYAKLIQMVEMTRAYGLSEMSNRRLIKILWVVLIHKMYSTVRDLPLTFTPSKKSGGERWHVLVNGRWDPLGPFSDEEIFEGLKGRTISPAHVCANTNSETELLAKDAISYSYMDVPNVVEIENADLALIPKYFLDKEDPELALKMERTLESAEDYGS